MLIVYCIERRDRAISFAWVATLASVVGGVTSYMIGAILWHYAGHAIIYSKFVSFIMSPQTFEHLSELFRENEWWTILVAGFTPIPYKAATLAAGFCHLSLIPFIICSFIARGARFFAVAITLKYFGGHVKWFIDKYMGIIFILTIILIVVAVKLFT
jgi:membrane protein YqaA with SNARE-associated domain